MAVWQIKPGNSLSGAPGARADRAPLAARRRGLTLLELMLALSLSVLILGMVAMSINLHLHTLDTRRTGVEEVELARAVLRQIRSDLQSVVQPHVVELDGLEQMLAATVPGGGSSFPGNMSASQGGFGADGQSLFDDELDGGLSFSIAETLAPPATPGLFGNQYELQVDVSRLPRPEEFYQLLMPGDLLGPSDIPSDVKTVAYYVQFDGATPPVPAAMAPAAGTGESGGLMRRQLDRAVTMWAAENGQLQGLELRAEPIAPEVRMIEFRFWDGFEWQYEWDSEWRQALPMAVEVTIGVARAHPSADPEELRYFRSVIRLPVARPPSFDELDAMAMGALP